MQSPPTRPKHGPRSLHRSLPLPPSEEAAKCPTEQEYLGSPPAAGHLPAPPPPARERSGLEVLQVL